MGCSASEVLGLIFFTFTLIFSLLSLLVFAARLMRPWCDCHVCRTYLTSDWSKEFDNLSDWYAHLLTKSPTGTIHVHVLGNTITSNPKNTEHILKTNFENYPKGKKFSDILGDLLGRGIFNVDGHHWRFQRKMASLELGANSVRSYALEIVSSEIESTLVPLLESSSSRNLDLDLQEVLREFSFRNICRFSFGLDPQSLNLSGSQLADFAAAFDTASGASAERALVASPLIWRVKRLFHMGSEKRLKEAVKTVDVLAAEIISLRRRESRLNVNEKQDLLSRFMSSLEDNNDTDDKYLRDIIVSFLLAGRDTIAAALTSFFYLMSRNPNSEQKIRAELDRVMGTGSDSVPGFKQMREMHYLHAAVHESMRLYPPVQFDSKHCRDDDVLPDGTFVRRGTRVTYHPYAMGRMEQIWGPDCLEFKPEKWIGADGLFLSVCPFKYPVFQAGPRVCLGKELAIMEMKAVVATLIRRFDIRTVGDGKEPRFVPGLTASIRGGLPVRVTRRI